MMARTTLFAALALALASTACQPPAQEAAGLSEEDVAAIRNAMQAHVDLVLAGDPAAIAPTYTEDAVQMPPNAPIVEGRAAIQEWFADFPAATDYVQSIVEVDGRDGIAYSRSNYSITFMVQGTPVTDIGKTVAIWKEQDGAWLAAAAIWNSDLPLPEQS
jgi:ketosteroid isomerase-like protein